MQFYFFSICILIGLSHVTAQFLNGYTNPMYNNPFAPFYDDPYAYNGYGYNNMMNPYMSYGAGANGMYMNPYFAYGLGNNMMGGMNGGMGGMNGGMGGMNGGIGGMNGGMGFSNYGSAGMGNRHGQRYSGANRLGNNLNNNAHLSHVSCRYGACTRSNNRAEK